MIEDLVMISQDIKIAEDNNIRIEYYTMNGSTKDIYMCPGDLMYICNVLYDYGRIFEAFMQEANIRGEEWKKYTYEYYLNRCRKIQEKIESSIEYSTEAAIDKCRKKQGKSERNEDVGEDALVLAIKHARKKQEQQPVKKTTEPEKAVKILKKNEKKTDDTGIAGQIELEDFLKYSLREEEECAKL